jgi:LysR family hydrogen peroxide-inducible transcriptional activator
MTNLTLKQLRYFEAVANLGHFGRAADVCSISQPAISVQIKELEQTLGAALFERSARQVKLTSFGTEFAGRAREILRSVDDLGDMGRATHEGLVGKLRLGIIPTIAPYLLPRIIGNLTLSHSDLDLHIRETMTDKLITELVEGRLDTAIVALPVSEPTLFEKPLFDENFVLVRPAGDSEKPVPSAGSLSNMRLLLLEEGHCFRDQALSFCGTRTPLPREGMDGSSLSTLVQLVGTGIGVTLIPEMAVGIETKSADVAISHFTAPQPSRTIGMVWRNTSPLSKQFTQIAEVVKQSADELLKP